MRFNELLISIVERFGRPMYAPPDHGVDTEGTCDTVVDKGTFKRADVNTHKDAVDIYFESHELSKRLTSLWFDSTDKAEYSAHRNLLVTGTDLVSDLPDLRIDPLYQRAVAKGRIEKSDFHSYTAGLGNSLWPNDFITLIRVAKKFPPFTFRLDSLRNKHAWCAGSIAALNLGRSADGDEGEPMIIVHFDGHSSAHDEIFKEHDFNRGRLAPLYSQSKRLLTLFEVRVCHRRSVPIDLPMESPTSKSKETGINVYATKETKENLPVTDAINQILGRSDRFHQPSGVKSTPGQDENAATISTDQIVGQESHEDTSKSNNVSSFTKTVYGMEPIPSSETFICQLESFKSCESAYRHIVEQVASRYLTNIELENFLRAGLTAVAEEDADPWEKKDIWDKLPFDIRIKSHNAETTRVFNHVAGYSELDHESENISKEWENTLFPRDTCRPLCNLYHNNLAVSIDWNRPLEVEERKLDATDEYYNRELSFDDDDEFRKIVDHHEKLMSEITDSGDARSGIPKTDGVSLIDCLRSYSSNETLDDDTWYCSSCKVHRRGEMKLWFYRLPDVLIIHIKRFNMTARWREKIRTKVDFPLEGLDMSEFMAEQFDDKVVESQESERGNGRSEYIYDLFSVVNHLGSMCSKDCIYKYSSFRFSGGMSGGHYTAAVRYNGHPIVKLSHNENSLVASQEEQKEGSQDIVNIDSIEATINEGPASTATTMTPSKDTSVDEKDDSVISIKTNRKDTNRVKKNHLRSISNVIKDFSGCSSSRGLSVQDTQELVNILSEEQRKSIPGHIGQV